MNIERIIKIYFLAVMVMISVAALSYNSGVKNLMASVFFVDATASETAALGDFGNSRLPKITYNPKFMANNVLQSFEFPLKNDVESSLVMEIINDEKLAYASPGARDAHLMDLVMKAAGGDMGLKSLNFKIEGIESFLIEKVVLRYGEVIYEAEIDNGYAKFPNLDLQFSDAEKQVLQIFVDLSPELKSSDRLRLNIENEVDLGIFAGGERYQPSQSYPVKGKYLTIANKRPLFLKSEKK